MGVGVGGWLAPPSGQSVRVLISALLAGRPSPKREAIDDHAGAKSQLSAVSALPTTGSPSGGEGPRPASEWRTWQWGWSLSAPPRLKFEAVEREGQKKNTDPTCQIEEGTNQAKRRGGPPGA